MRVAAIDKYILVQAAYAPAYPGLAVTDIPRR